MSALLITNPSVLSKYLYSSWCKFFAVSFQFSFGDSAIPSIRMLLHLYRPRYVLIKFGNSLCLHTISLFTDLSCPCNFSIFFSFCSTLSVFKLSESHSLAFPVSRLYWYFLLNFSLNLSGCCVVIFLLVLITENIVFSCDLNNDSCLLYGSRNISVNIFLIYSVEIWHSPILLKVITNKV